MINIQEMPLPDLVMFTLLILIVLYIIKAISNKKESNIKKTQITKHNSFFENKNKKLREEYINLHGFSRPHAAESLDRQIILLRKKYPNKNLDWYIKKAIHDLKRDRHIN